MKKEVVEMNKKNHHFKLKRKAWHSVVCCGENKSIRSSHCSNVIKVHLNNHYILQNSRLLISLSLFLFFLVLFLSLFFFAVFLSAHLTLHIRLREMTQSYHASKVALVLCFGIICACVSTLEIPNQFFRW